MKRAWIVGAVALGAALVAGCTNMETNRVGEQVSIHMPVYIHPDVEVKNERISGSATVHCILGIFCWGPSEWAVGLNYGTAGFQLGADLVRFSNELLPVVSTSEALARNAAAYDAAQKGEADILLAPQYVLTTDNYFLYKKVKCEVKGFPGALKGVEVVDSPCAAAGCRPCGGKAMPCPPLCADKKCKPDHPVCGDKAALCPKPPCADKAGQPPCPPPAPPAAPSTPPAQP